MDHTPLHFDDLSYSNTYSSNTYSKNINSLDRVLLSIFKSITFKLVDNLSGYYTYAACIEGMLAGNFKRYILLFVRDDGFPPRKFGKIHELDFVNLQTRTIIDTKYKLRPQQFKLDSNTSSTANSIILHVKRRTAKSTEYSNTDYSIEVLHNPKKKSIYQYANKLSLIAIIDTFQSIFTKIECDDRACEPVSRGLSEELHSDYDLL